MIVDLHKAMEDPSSVGDRLGYALQAACHDSCHGQELLTAASPEATPSRLRAGSKHSRIAGYTLSMAPWLEEPIIVLFCNTLRSMWM